MIRPPRQIFPHGLELPENGFLLPPAAEFDPPFENAWTLGRARISWNDGTAACLLAENILCQPGFRNSFEIGIARLVGPSVLLRQFQEATGDVTKPAVLYFWTHMHRIRFASAILVQVQCSVAAGNYEITEQLRLLGYAQTTEWLSELRPEIVPAQLAGRPRRGICLADL